MAKLRPTFKQLREAAIKEKLGIEVFQQIDDLEAKCIRVIQIQAQMKELDAEQGYMDQYTGKRHPGIRDEIEKQFIILNMFDGMKIEDYDIDLVCGKGPDWVDPIELLRLGVPDEVIKKATRVGKGWTAIRCQKRQTRKKQ